MTADVLPENDARPAGYAELTARLGIRAIGNWHESLVRTGGVLWGKAWAQIEPRDPAQLAQMVYGQVQDDGFALRDHMIRDFAAALGRKGLLRLKDMFLQQHKARQADEGLDDWQRSEPLRHVAEVADALGDVGRTKAYHHAADYLAITHDLAGRADLSAEQQEMLFHLREKHGRKYSFWERVNE